MMHISFMFSTFRFGYTAPHMLTFCFTSVCVVSILRLQSLVAISNSKDPTYDNTPAATWSSVETNVGIICSCLPCLRPLMARCFPNVFSSNKYGANSGPHHNRSAYGRHSAGPDTMLSAIDAKHSRRSSDTDNHDDRIQVTTEVHVSVEGKYDKESQIERQSSTETLVRDIRNVL